MTTMHPVVLLIDDQWGEAGDPMMQRYASLPFQWRKCSATASRGTYTVEAAMAGLQANQSDVVLLDMMFGRHSPRLGLDILREIKKAHPFLPVIMFTAMKTREDRELTIKCLSCGASEFLEKPPSVERMQTVLSRYTGSGSDGTIYGDSFAIRDLRARIAKIAMDGRATVRIHGEIGTGKTLVAKTLHRFGPRRQGPFVFLNVAEMHAETAESVLFGHERGAFTNAHALRRGVLEVADGGVLFLDEIASVPLAVQGKLLVALQEREFRRLGGTELIRSDFQLVCAANETLESVVQDGRMREDFLSRLQMVRLVVPPLRERGTDIRLLAQRYLQTLLRDPNVAESHPGRRLSEESLERMELYHWPYNVRELQDRIHEALIFSTEEEFDIGELDVDPDQTAPVPGRTFDPELPADPARWVHERLLAELRLAVKAKRHIETAERKGPKWRSMFIQKLYPLLASRNPRGCFDLVVRLTEKPWGSPELLKHPEALALIDELCPPAERRKFQAERAKRRKK